MGGSGSRQSKSPLVVAFGLGQLGGVDRDEAPLLTVVAAGVAIDEAAAKREAVAQGDGAVAILSNRSSQVVPGRGACDDDAGYANTYGELSCAAAFSVNGAVAPIAIVPRTAGLTLPVLDLRGGAGCSVFRLSHRGELGQDS